MKLEVYEVRMLPEKVEALKVLARRLAYERNKKVSWIDLTREGTELILERYATAEKTAVGGVR